MQKNTIKSCFLFALLTLAVLCCLAGCSSAPKSLLDPKNPVEIVVWHYYHGAQKTAFDDMVKEFNETVGYEKGIIIEPVSHGGVDELFANVLAAAKGELDAGPMPNVFGSYGDTALTVLNMGLAAEIDAYLSPEQLAEYEDAFIHEGRIGTDKLYVFPIAKSSESLMINKTDFDAFIEGLKSSGINETVSYDDLATWEGILRVADIYYRYTEAQNPEVGGKALLGIDSLANFLIVGSKQLRQDIVTVENGRVTISLEPEIMNRLWYTYYQPMVMGRFAKLGRFCSDDIKTGDILCFVGSTSSASYFPTELMLDNGGIRAIELAVLPMPVFEGGNKVAISQGAGMVIAKSSPEKEYASAVFLQWFTEAERNIYFSLVASYLPVKKQALDESLLAPAFAAIASDETARQNSVKALKVGIEQLREYTMYTSDVFDGALDFRNLMPVGLHTAVAEDRAAYLRHIASGLSPDQAWAELRRQCGPKIEAWLNSLTM